MGVAEVYHEKISEVVGWHNLIGFNIQLGLS